MFFAFLSTFGEGFLVKTIASFDDTLTRIPIISHLTRTRTGRIAFSVGTLLALTVILILAVFFSKLLSLIPYTRQVSAALIFILALMVYFNILDSNPGRKLETKYIDENMTPNLLKVAWAGFVVSFITLIDDSFVLVPLFLRDHTSNIATVLGVYIAALVQILIVIYFGERLQKIPRKKEMATGALILLSFLVAFSIV